MRGSHRLLVLLPVAMVLAFSMSVTEARADTQPLQRDSRKMARPDAAPEPFAEPRGSTTEPDTTSNSHDEEVPPVPETDGAAPVFGDDFVATWRLSAGLATYSVTTLLNDDEALGHFFVMGNVAAVFGFTEYWQLAVAVRAGGAVAGDAPETAVGVLLDGRFIIDRMTWTPWISFGIGGLYRSRGTNAYLGGAETERLDFSVHAGLGLDYDIGDGWGMGVVARYHLLLTDDLARVIGPIEISLQATFDFP